MAIIDGVYRESATQEALRNSYTGSSLSFRSFRAVVHLTLLSRLLPELLTVLQSLWTLRLSVFILTRDALRSQFMTWKEIHSFLFIYLF